MKKITTLLTLLIVNIISAQSNVSLSSATPDDYTNNNHITDVDNKLDPFVGIWQWTNGTEILTIKMVKKLNYNPNSLNNYFYDVILGGLKYEKNNVVLYDNLNFTTSNNVQINSNYSDILGSYRNSNVNLRIFMSDRHKNRNLEGYFTLQFDPNSIPIGQTVFTARLNVRAYSKRFLTPNEPAPLPGISFPYDVILTKIP